MSIDSVKEKIIRNLREQIETNTIDSLETFMQEATEKFDLDGSPDVQMELKALVESVYQEYQKTNHFDYDDVVEQTFPASDPPPPGPAPAEPAGYDSPDQ